MLVVFSKTCITICLSGVVQHDIFLTDDIHEKRKDNNVYCIRCDKKPLWSNVQSKISKVHYRKFHKKCPDKKLGCCRFRCLLAKIWTT